MTPAVLLTTLDAVLAALPEDMDKEHRERLQLVRDLLGLVLTVRKLLSDKVQNKPMEARRQGVLPLVYSGAWLGKRSGCSRSLTADC